MRLYWSFFLFFHCWKVWMFLKKLSCPQVSNISSPHSIWMHLTVETKSSFDRRPWVWTRSSLPAMSALLPRWNDFAALTMFFSHWKHMRWSWDDRVDGIHPGRRSGPAAPDTPWDREAQWVNHVDCELYNYIRTYVLFFVSIFLQTFISVYLAVWS